MYIHINKADKLSNLFFSKLWESHQRQLPCMHDLLKIRKMNY